MTPQKAMSATELLLLEKVDVEPPRFNLHPKGIPSGFVLNRKYIFFAEMGIAR